MHTVLPDGKVVNESGQVALRYNALSQRLVQVGTHEYLFHIQANISLAWIYPEDVDKLLAMRGGCCGGQAQLCHVATELDVRRWTGEGV